MLVSIDVGFSTTKICIEGDDGIVLGVIETPPFSVTWRHYS
jgi:hypothetical protein